MRVLYLDWPCFGREDVLDCLERQFGFEVEKFIHKDYTERKSAGFDAAFDEAVKDRDIAFSFSYNFFPLMAEGCKRHGIKYVSLIYDSPFVKLYSYTVAYPTNYVFLFDFELYRTLKEGGIDTVYYMVLPVNSEKILEMIKKPYDRSRTVCDISFVGNLYNEDHNIFDGMYEKLDEHTRGYIDGVMQAQLLVSGYSFVESVLTDDIVKNMNVAEPYVPNPDGVETLPYVYADYYLARKMTSMERIKLLNAVADRFDLRLFTLNPKAAVPNAHNMGITDYNTEMPLVFHDSRININITLRSIKSGIPLRCMDILGAGGFLMTNYQADLLSFFVPGEDFVYFEDEADLLKKCEYYLAHEDERATIAQNGYRKVRENHSYLKAFSEMFDVAGV